MPPEPVHAIDGKPIREFVGLPYGEFAKLARKRVDPLWGILGYNLKPFKVNVTIERTRREEDEEVVIVAAPDKETAKKLAEEKVMETEKEHCSYSDWDDIEYNAWDAKEIKEDTYKNRKSKDKDNLHPFMD